MSHDLPENIARLQWNNRLKSMLVMLMFVFGITVFAVTLVLMVVVPLSLVPDSGISLQELVDNPKVHRNALKYFLKVLFFCMGGALYFIYRGLARVGDLFSAVPLKLSHTDPFYRMLENLCISRGLKTPDLYMFKPVAIPSNILTAAVVQGVSQKAALIVTNAALSLPPAEMEAFAAQVVQRLYTKDTHFLTLFSFLGYFPWHILSNTNVFGRVLFKLPLKAADIVMEPARAMVMNLRFARLDVGSLELTKDREAMMRVLEKIAPIETVGKYFHDPYLPLFLMGAQGLHRQQALQGKI